MREQRKLQDAKTGDYRVTQQARYFIFPPDAPAGAHIQVHRPRKPADPTDLADVGDAHARVQHRSAPSPSKPAAPRTQLRVHRLQLDVMPTSLQGQGPPKRKRELVLKRADVAAGKNACNAASKV